MKKAAILSWLIVSLFILSAIGGEVQAAVTFTAPELLCRPTDHSVTVNIVANQTIEAYFEYGTTPGVYPNHTGTATFAGGTPIQVVINDLSPNTRYYYRMVYREVGTTTWMYRNEHSFITQRSRGDTFTFTIISDSHMNGGGGSVSRYQQTLNNVLADHPDFHLDLGDTFWMDGVTSSTTANQRYVQQRVYMGAISPSVPIFVSTGNHENEEGWNFDDTNSKALLSVNARKLYYPSPITDGFYSGNDDTLAAINGDHLREDYYAWEWGDALFVVIDPFQYTMRNPYGPIAGEGNDEGAASHDRWDWTLGQQQFNWFKHVLENSDAKFKFVFDHQPVGGSEDYVRGGAGPANLFEWGGYDANGTTWGFAARRPGWGDTPIHQLMVANGVTAYFHGHDHVYAYEERDGVVYQEVPSPALTGYGFYSYYSNPYAIEVLPSPGHLRVTVTPTQVTVDYVTTTGGTVNYSYTVSASNCTPLSAPSNLQAIAASSSTIDLSWSEVSGAAQYRVSRSGTAGGPYSFVGTAVAPATLFSDSGLTGGTTYFYVVRSFGSGDSGCESADSNEATATTPLSPAPPTATITANPTVIQLGQSSVLTWSTTNATSATISGIGAVSLSGSQAISPSTTTTYTLTASGSGGTVTASATVTVSLPPSAPTNLTATILTGPQVRLSWTDNATNETGFVIERCTGAGCTGFALIAAPGSKSGTGTVTYTDTGVVAGNTYLYRVKAVNAVGSSNYAGPVSVTLTTAGTPNSPSNLTATVQAGPQVRLSWTDNATNETGFVVERCTGVGCTGFARIAAPRSKSGTGSVTYTDTRVVAGNTYLYRVKAVNAVGSSNYVGPVSVTLTTAGAPNSPSDLTATVQTGSQVRLSWTDNATNETGFVIERCAGVGCTGFAQIAAPGSKSGTGTVTYTDTGVVAGNTYLYRVKAVNAVGSSNYAGPVSVTLTAGAPNSPTNLTAAIQTGPQVRLSWTDNATNETGFVVERCTGVGCTGFAQIAAPGSKSGTGTVTYTDTGVTAGNTYLYRVKAVNGTVSSTYSNTAIAAVTVPAAPTNLALTIVASGQIQVTWTDNSTDETGFEGQDSLDNFVTVRNTATAGANVTTAIDPDTSPHTTYWLRVRAVNAFGKSAWSNVASITIP